MLSTVSFHLPGHPLGSDHYHHHVVDGGWGLCEQSHNQTIVWFRQFNLTFLPKPLLLPYPSLFLANIRGLFKGNLLPVCIFLKDLSLWVTYTWFILFFVLCT